MLPLNTVTALVYVPAVPLTSKRAFGFIAFIPTLPSEAMRSLSQSLVMNLNAGLDVEPPLLA